MANFLIGLEFNARHGAGVSTYRVTRPHRDAGYFECVTVDFAPVPPFTAAGWLGAIEVFSRRDIESKVVRFSAHAVEV